MLVLLVLVMKTRIVCKRHEMHDMLPSARPLSSLDLGPTLKLYALKRLTQDLGPPSAPIEEEVEGVDIAARRTATIDKDAGDGG